MNSALILAKLPIPILNDPLYGGLIAGVMLLLGVICFTKIEKPVIGLIFLAGFGIIAYNLFISIGN